MRRLLLLVTAGTLLALGSASNAAAAVPGLGGVGATNLQGVSALLEGSVDPEGLATEYQFEYVDSARFASEGFASAAKTPLSSAGSGTAPVQARATVAGLSPSTAYRVRLVATNESGPASAEGEFTTSAGFGLLPGGEGFSAEAISEGGGVAQQAGLHPYQVNLHVGFRSGGEFEDQPGFEFPDGDVREMTISMPPGFLINGSVLNRCGAADFATARTSPFEASRSGEDCPIASQVGTVEVGTAGDGGEPRRFGVFNLAPPPGVAAQIGFAPYGSPVVLGVAIQERPDGSYVMVLRARNMPQALDLRDLSLSLWGTPWGTSHDGERGDCLKETEPDFPWAKCSVGPPKNFDRKAYLSLPTTCSPNLAFGLRVSSWQQSGEASAEAVNRDGGEPAPVSGCGSLQTDVSATGVLSDRKASSPTGYGFSLTSNTLRVTDPQFLVTPSIQRARISLPNGVTVNPSVGEGLVTCAPAQYAAETPLSAAGAGCPNASRLGDFSVRSPLFEVGELFSGTVYLATPNDPGTPTPGAENPFDSLLAIYLIAKLPERGVQVKLAGKLEPNPASGDLVAIFDSLPQIPYTDLRVTFRTGQRSLLVTPAACGQAISRIEMTPWAQGVPSTTVSDGSVIDAGSEGAPCPSGVPPFNPGSTAGAVNSNVGAYTPYFVHLTRRDPEQEITSYSLVLPKGITGKLAGIPFCPDAAIAAARTRRGAAETASPSCPATSQVGRTVTGYGVGAALTYAPGRIYLGGPYKGAPLSLVTINAATVGPFDLGVIVIRSAFQVDQTTAQLRIDSRASDPIPHILEGVPLHLRDIRIYMDRPEFTHNPSSCEPSALVSSLTGSGARFGDPADDSTATVGSHFQLLNCLTLGFQPKLGIRLRGGAERGDYPQLRVTFASRGPQDSNLKRIEVAMPHSEFLANEHIRQICTRPKFQAETCPAESEYGRAVAYTPLFDEPLRGKVYLRSSPDRALPDLVANLRSGAIRIAVEGRIGSAKGGGIRALFTDLPDAPINRFVMTLYGGERGLLVNSANICTSPPRAIVRALGQNNLGSAFTTTLRGQCGDNAKAKGGR